MLIKLLVLLPLIFGTGAHAESELHDDDDTGGKNLISCHSPCEEILNPDAAVHEVLPWFHVDNPLAKVAGLGGMRHKFAQAFTFSPDGKYALIHHDIYPDGEQLSLRSLETGENLSSLLQRGKGQRLFHLRSATFDGQSRRIVSLAENFFSDKTDEVLSWDGRSENLLEKVEIQPPQPGDYVRVNGGGTNDHSFRTPVTLDPPYYIRTNLRSSRHRGHDWETSWIREYSAQLVDWRAKQWLNLPKTSTEFLSVIAEPLNATFKYAAILRDDRTTVQLIPFAEIDRQIQKAAAPAPALLGRVQNALAYLAGKTTSTKTLALPGPKPKREPVTAPNFSGTLTHNQPVRKVILSKWAPFVITQTAAGLHIWNAKTGAAIGKIPPPIKDARIFKKIGLLAYADDKGNVILYSLFQGAQLLKLPGFTFYNINARIENREPGIAYLTMDDGKVFEIREDTAGGNLAPFYKIQPMGIYLKIPMNTSYRTAVETAKGRYLAQVYEDRTGDRVILKVDVYALDGGGAKLAALEYPVAAFQSQFKLDPTGRKVLYTIDETKTGILHLDRLLREHDL